MGGKKAREDIDKKIQAEARPTIPFKKKKQGKKKINPAPASGLPSLQNMGGNRWKKGEKDDEKLRQHEGNGK